MKKNLLLTLTCCCAAACWSAGIPVQEITVSDNSATDLKLLPSTVRILPDGQQVVETPAYTPVGSLPVMEEESHKGYRLDSLTSVRPDGSKYSKQYFEYDDNGKILKQEDSFYNNETKDYDINNRYIYTWYDNGYLKSDEQIDAKGNALRNEYKYNAQNLGIEKVTFRRSGADGEYVFYRKGEYDYDDRSNMTLEAIYKWENDNWVMTSRTTATYDDYDYRSGYEIWKLTGGEWVGSEKKDMVNDAKGRNTLLVSYSWERQTPGIFEPFSRLTQIFDDNANPELVTQKFEYYNLDEEDWCGNFLDRGGAERHNINASKEYDDKKRVTLSYAEDLYGDEWFRGSYSDYVYTDHPDGSYECVKKSYLRTRDQEDFTLKEIVTTNINASGLITYYYDNYLPNLKLSIEYYDTFDENGNNTAREEYRFDTEGNRYFYLKYENTFDDWGNIIDTYNWKGEKNDSGLPDSWIYSSRFTYNYEMDGTVRTDKKRYKFDEATGSWLNDWGEGADFDFTVPVNDIVIPTGYTAEYMQTAKYSYKGNETGWDTTKFDFYYTKNEGVGVEAVNDDNGSISFRDNTLYVKGGSLIENSVYTTDGVRVYTGNNTQEDLGTLGKGIYIIRSIVDGDTSVIKVTIR